MSAVQQPMKIYEEDFLIVVDEMLPLYEIVLKDESYQVNEFRFKEYSENEFMRFERWFKTEAMFYILSKSESLKADEIRFTKLRHFREKLAMT